MSRERLKCSVCGEFIRKSGDDYDDQILVQGHSQIESAVHLSCRPLAIPPDSPFQAAVQKAKQAVEDARRLGPDAFGDFVAIIRLALAEQR